MDTQFTQQLNTEIEKLKSYDYTSYQNFYNETSQYLYGVIWNMVQDQGTADTLIQELYTNIYASIASELMDNSQFYMWAENKAQMLATTYLTTHGLVGAYAAAGGVAADEAVAAVAANAGVDVAVGAGQAGVGVAAATAGQAGMGTAAATAGQAGMGTAAATAGQAGMGTVAATAGQAGMGTAAAGAGQAGVGAAAYGAGVSGIGGASGAGIATGIAHAGMSLGAKIAIGIAATAVTVGGGLGLHHVIADREKPTETTTEIVEEIATDLDAATDSDAVEFVEEITDSNPVFAGYCLEQVVDDGDKGEVDGSIYYFRFVGDSTPELKQSFETWQKQWVDDYYVMMDTYADEYSMSEESGEYVDDKVLHFWGECIRADNRILTVTHYQLAAGGNSGGDFYYLATTTNFDVQTGKILTLDDIGDVKGDLQNALTQYCQNAHNEGKYISSWWEESIDEQIADNTLDWGMAYGYFFVQYEDYGGSYTIKIPYSELPGIKPEYLPEGNVYFEEIGRVSENYDNSVQYDIDGDGVLEAVGIAWTWGENASDIFYLTIDGTAVTEQFTAESYDAYLCSMSEKTYVILEIYGNATNSDYYIYDISSGAAVELQRFTDCTYMPIGPYPTARRTRIDVLGTYNGYKIYNLGPEGLTTDYNYYIFEDAEEVTLIAKTEIPCKFEKDGMLGEGTIPAGTVIYPVECDTDNLVFVFRMEDGTRGRFYYAQDENGITINGVPETELFGNLPYTD